MGSGIDKVAFYISDKRHFDYFNNLLRQMQVDGIPFELILNDTLGFKYGEDQYPEEYLQDMIRTAGEREFPFRLFSEAASGSDRYRAIVSTITYRYKVPYGKPSYKQLLKKIAAMVLYKLIRQKKFRKISAKPHRKQIYPETALSKYVICFPKGMDVDEHYPDSRVKKISDLFFCHGNLDKRLVRKNSEKDGFVIGYPRYDNISVYGETPSERLISEFDLDPEKKLITWLPTYFPREKTLDSNIDEWISLMVPLLEKYNIILRPHPKRLERYSDFQSEKLLSMGFRLDTVGDRDMSELYASSGFIFCDYGGTVFSAIYTDCNLLLLNHSYHQSYAAENPTAVHIQIRKTLVNVTPDEIRAAGGFRSLLEDDMLWQREREKRIAVRNEYFGGVKPGEGSKLAAGKLKELLYGDEKSEK